MFSANTYYYTDILLLLLIAVAGLAVSWFLLQRINRSVFQPLFLDNPDQRKPHQRLIPRLGGTAILLGTLFFVSLFSVWMFWTNPGIPWQSLGMLVPLFLLLTIAILDDTSLMQKVLHRKKLSQATAWDCPASVKFLLQFLLASYALWFFQIDFSRLQLFGHWFDPGPLVNVLAIIWIVGVMNAVNMTDGIDGLAGSITLATLAFFAVLFTFVAPATPGVTPTIYWLLGAYGAFLLMNWAPAILFMGDAGSLTSGFFFGILPLIFVNHSPSASAAASSALPATSGLDVMLIPLMTGYPLLEVFSSMGRRFVFLPQGSGLVRRMKQMIRPDSNHFHHRMLHKGLGPRSAALILCSMHLFFLLSSFSGIYYAAYLKWIYLFVFFASIMFVFSLYSPRNFTHRIKTLFYPIRPRRYQIGLIHEESLLLNTLMKSAPEEIHFSRISENIEELDGMHGLIVEQKTEESDQELVDRIRRIRESILAIKEQVIPVVVICKNPDQQELAELPLFEWEGRMVLLRSPAFASIVLSQIGNLISFHKGYQSGGRATMKMQQLGIQGRI